MSLKFTVIFFFQSLTCAAMNLEDQKIDTCINLIKTVTLKSQRILSTTFIILIIWVICISLYQSINLQDTLFL